MMTTPLTHIVIFILTIATFVHQPVIAGAGIQPVAAKIQLLESKTPYDHRAPFLRSGNFIPGPDMSLSKDPSGYKPVFVYILTRHGARNPTADGTASLNTQVQPLLKVQWYICRSRYPTVCR